jgi:hypothetical protein
MRLNCLPWIALLALVDTDRGGITFLPRVRGCGLAEVIPHTNGGGFDLRLVKEDGVDVLLLDSALLVEHRDVD